MLFTNKTTHCFFQPDYCVFVILFIIYSHPYHHHRYYILYTFLPLECAPLALFYIRHAHAYTHTISQPGAMEVRPHSHPERTGPYMPGIITDSGIGHTLRSRDIGPDTDGKGDLQRLIHKRTQQLKDDRQSLKDRLERYIQLRATQHWTPPTHPSYNLFDARLKSFDTWTHKEGIPSPESLAEAGFFYRGKYMCIPLHKPLFFLPSITLSKTFFTRIKHFVFSGKLDSVNCFHCDIGLRDWIRGDDAYAEHARWSPYCVFLTFVKGKPFIDECRRLARQNGAGDILTLALNE